MSLSENVLKVDIEKLVRDETPDAVIAITPAGKIVHWNKGAENLFGYHTTEAIGQSIEELIVPADQRQENRQRLQETLHKGSSTYESMRKTKGGALVYVDVSSKSLPNGSSRSSAR